MDLKITILKNFFTFSYVVSSTELRQALIVDPVWDYAAIINHLTGLELQGILLTHHHFDHINLAEKLARTYGAPVFMAREEIDYYGFRCHNLQGITGDVPLVLGQFIVEPLLTPGHTAGSSCYKMDCNLFTGDTVFIEGCGMCNLAGGDPYAMYDSLQRLKKEISPVVKIYPGHSYGDTPGRTFAFLLKNNVYFNFDDCASFVAFRMRKQQKGLFSFK